jgi:ribulose-5-phosphate 4-epimerase/fuculose-1-phosphate aldolase
MIDDGVVKYNLEYTQTEEIAVKECSRIEKVRARLYSLGLIGAYANGIGFGNVSLRYKKKDAFVITGTQTGELPKLSAKYYSYIIKVDFKSFKTIAMGPSKPSSEAITHACIYALDKNIKAVIHIHNKRIWDYMLENDYLSTEDTPYGTPEMVKDIKKMYKNIDPFLNNVFVMKGHEEGIVAFGETLAHAEKSLYKILKNVLKS